MNFAVIPLLYFRQRTDVLRPASKAVLDDAPWKEVKEHLIDSSMIHPLYVLDGGALLHRIPWSRGAIFDEIMYVTGMYSMLLENIADAAQCLMGTTKDHQ